MPHLSNVQALTPTLIGQPQLHIERRPVITVIIVRETLPSNLGTTHSLNLAEVILLKEVGPSAFAGWEHQIK